jgi:hypothetical protein
MLLNVKTIKRETRFSCNKKNTDQRKSWENERESTKKLKTHKPKTNKRPEKIRSKGNQREKRKKKEREKLNSLD